MPLVSLNQLRNLYVDAGSIRMAERYRLPGLTCFDDFVMFAHDQNVLHHSYGMGCRIGYVIWLSLLNRISGQR
jgi:hypothetical protein